MRKHEVYVLIHQYSFFSVPIAAYGGDRDGENEMDFALHQPWADAQGYNLSPLRGWLFSAAMSIHTIRKHAFVYDFRGEYTQRWCLAICTASG